MHRVSKLRTTSTNLKFCLNAKKYNQQQQHLTVIQKLKLFQKIKMWFVVAKSINGFRHHREPSVIRVISRVQLNILQYYYIQDMTIIIGSELFRSPLFVCHCYNSPITLFKHRGNWHFNALKLAVPFLYMLCFHFSLLYF